MGYENMGGAPVPPPFSFETGYVDGGLAQPEQQAPADQYAGVSPHTLAEELAAARVAEEQAATLSDPRSEIYVRPIHPSVTDKSAIRVPTAIIGTAEPFVELYGGSGAIVAEMREHGATHSQIAAELRRLLRYQRALMGIQPPDSGESAGPDAGQ